MDPNISPTSTASAHVTAAGATMPPRHYLNESGGWQSWLLTTDHKRIGLLYLFTITAFFFLGGIFALMIRLELMTPGGDLMTRTPTTACSRCTG
jgi:cytochrome c oxidase subunit I